MATKSKPNQNKENNNKENTTNRNKKNIKEITKGIFGNKIKIKK